jgi:hypothetical protein
MASCGVLDNDTNMKSSFVICLLVLGSTDSKAQVEGENQMPVGM